MPTFRATPGLNLTTKQQEVLAAAVTTPAVTESLQRIAEQMLAPLTPVFAELHRQAAASIPNDLQRQFAERQRSVLADALRPAIATRVPVIALNPIFDEIARRQRDWARRLAVPLVPNAEAAWSAGLFAGLERIRVMSPLQVELPDVAGWDRLAELVSEGRFDAPTVAAAETEVAGDAETSEAIDEAAEMLAQQRPERSATQWRTAIVVGVWSMWILALAGAGVVVPAPLMAAIGLAVGRAAQVTAAGAGDWVDRRSATGQDGDDD